MLNEEEHLQTSRKLQLDVSMRKSVQKPRLEKKSSLLLLTPFPSLNQGRDKGNPAELEGGRREGGEGQNREAEEMAPRPPLFSLQASSLKEAHARRGQKL